MATYSALGISVMRLRVDGFGSIPSRWSKRERIRASWDGGSGVNNNGVDPENFCRRGSHLFLGFTVHEIGVVASMVLIDDTILLVLSVTRYRGPIHLIVLYD
mmetsp:Transcript_7034/g.16961  ORF Transcript_7034/g.16961 Transcript_7034/m.16961 type:complete len:102 (-) Transcript_7034:55-360(-)